MYRFADPTNKTIVRLSDGATIPCDFSNADYARIVSGGFEIAQYEPPPEQPVTVTPWQAREALRITGKLAAVNAFIDNLGGEHPAYVAYHYAERFSRASPLIAALKDQLGFTDKDLDDLFALAKTLRL